MIYVVLYFVIMAISLGVISYLEDENITNSTSNENDYGIVFLFAIFWPITIITGGSYYITRFLYTFFTKKKAISAVKKEEK